MFKLFRKKKEKNRFKRAGNRVVVQDNCRIYHSENIAVGDNVLIGQGALIEAMGGLEIGSNVVFGPDVTVWTANHNYERPLKVPYDSGVNLKKVVIMDNVWIGAKSIIIPGVTIHEGAVVAMGAVVCNDVPKGAVVGGNPAKILKYRDIGCYDKLVTDKKFFDFHSE